MRVVGTFHPSSSVTRSLKCCLTTNTTLEHLVVAKTDRLEVYSLLPEGLREECTTDMWGRVVGLQAIPAKERGRSYVLVMTDHPDPKLVVMAYEEGAPHLITQSSLSLEDRAARPAEFVTDVQVDPTGKLAIVCCFTGKLKVVPLKDGVLGTSFDVSLPELNLLAFTFLFTKKGRYALAFLHLNHRRQIQLLCRDVLLDELELSSAHSNLVITTVLSERTFPSLEPPPLLVPIPPHTTGDEEADENADLAGHRGGVLVLGGRKIMFYEHSTKEQQDTRAGKHRRLSSRLKSDKRDEVTAARKKEEERESRKVKPRANVKWPWGPLTAWCAVGAACRRLMLGDALGRLAMLVFDDDQMCMTLLPLGETSPATSLSYLSAQFLYLGSHSGDSQLLRIHPQPIANADSDTLPIPKGLSTVSPSSLQSSGKGKGKAMDSEDLGGKDGRIVNTKGTFLEVSKTYDNVAPIMDAVLADIDGSGQPQVITCSGARNTGSLRVIRTEANFQEYARLDGLSGITDIWPVKSNSGDREHSHIVVSTLRHSLLFSLAGKDSVVHVDPSVAGFSTNVPTLALGNIPRRQVTASGKSIYVDSPLILQVTSEGMHMVEYDPTLRTFGRVAGWLPKEAGRDFAHREIVAATMNPSQFLVGLSGGRLALFNLGQGDTLQLQMTRDYPDEICAISCKPLDSSKSFAKSVAVSFWGSNKVAILSLGQNLLAPVCEVTTPALPRSLLLHNFGTSGPTGGDFRPYLLVGLADGTLLTYAFRDKELVDRKQSSLGNAPVSLSVVESEKRTVVLVSGTRANLLFWDRQRVRPSPVSIKNTVRGTTLNTAAFPSCSAIATSSSLVIGTVRVLDKMQIRTVPLGLDNPRKIAYLAEQQVFGVACTRTVPGRIGDVEETSGWFKLLDAHSFRQLDNYLCNPDEEPTAVLALPGSNEAVFCLGTVTIRESEREPSHGRIVLFSLDPPQTPRTRAPCMRAVYAIVRLSDDYLAVAVNTSVVAVRIRRDERNEYSLKSEAKWDHNYFVTNLVFDGQHLLVGDAISSVSIITWDVAAKRFQSVARDYGPLWPVSIEATGNGVIGANSDCNLFSFAVQEGHPRTKLERDGVYHVGDVVNKFLRGALSTTDAAEERAVTGSHVFFTASGRIGVIMDMASRDLSVQMTTLQHNMAKTLVGPGKVNHTKLRAPANPRGRTDAEASVGFLDGDFLEQFLTHPEAEQFVKGEFDAERVRLSVEEVKDVLVQMQGLH
ncbi:mono-functional DNA-alkylating methyl methanesulfonate N-term-domain-containing protein [Daedaleopsis nitida]|nr:mono-functional DNA-alkylating methyl methanesulfonate N-term-domain-containing protein [Daedaleopsis nitida]